MAGRSGLPRLRDIIENIDLVAEALADVCLEDFLCSSPLNEPLKSFLKPPDTSLLNSGVGFQRCPGEISRPSAISSATNIIVLTPILFGTWPKIICRRFDQ